MVLGVRFAIAGWVVLAVCGVAVGADRPPAPVDVPALDGVWLANSAQLNRESRLSLAWKSTFTIKGGVFVVSHFCGSSRELKGALTARPDVGPMAVDLEVEAVDLSEVWESAKYPACTLPGIWKIDGGRLTICFQTGPSRRRPAEFVSDRRDTVLLSLERAHDGFKEFPKEVTVSVRDTDRKPAAGANVFQFMSRGIDPKKPEWHYGPDTKTGADGTVRVSYESLAGYPAMARDTARKLAGLTAVSPASLQEAGVTVTLAPWGALSGTVVCPELDKPGKPVEVRMTYLLRDGERIGNSPVFAGAFEYAAVPPGRYTVYAYGGSVGQRYVEIEVPAGEAEVRMPPIQVDPSPLALLEGKPAPELDGVVGWKGKPVKLADLRGQVVLLDFWGYWCGPCVAEMPTIIALHERFKDRGLAIVGVHDDDHGEVDTAAALDEKLARIRRELWGGKDVPFPVALTSGAARNDDGVRMGAVAQYGIRYVPTAVLIDRQGKVVGTFEVADRDNPEEMKKMNDRMEKLLGGGN
jgi:uncharacterized protein (TIGR03067 family)